MKIKKLISSLLVTLFLLGITNVSHAEVLSVEKYKSYVYDYYLTFPPLELEDDIQDWKNPPRHWKYQQPWIEDVICPRLRVSVKNVRQYIARLPELGRAGLSNTVKFLLLYEKIWPMCTNFVHGLHQDPNADGFVEEALSTVSLYSDSMKKFGDKCGLAKILWNVYHRVPCMSSEMACILNISSSYNEIMFNLKNLCLAYYQLACDREGYRGIKCDLLIERLEFGCASI